jgi:hypothetical protein
MMRDIHFGFKLPFDDPQDMEDSEDLLMRMLGINCRYNLQYLRKNPDTKALYDSGVVYTPPDQADGRPPIQKDDLKKLLKLLRNMGCDPETALMIVRMLKGIEIFLDIPGLLRRGKGDCNELVPMRVAELWSAGIAASPYLIKDRNERGGWTYHALVLWPDGSSEDPSLILGMGGPDHATERRVECYKNMERWQNYMDAAKRLVAAEGASANDAADAVDQMGLIPKIGYFASPYDQGEQRAA